MKSFYKIASNFPCLSLSEQQPGLNIIKQTASNVMAGSFEAMGRLERNIIDLYKYENCQQSAGQQVQSGLVRVGFRKSNIKSDFVGDLC